LGDETLCSDDLLREMLQPWISERNLHSCLHLVVGVEELPYRMPRPRTSWVRGNPCIAPPERTPLTPVEELSDSTGKTSSSIVEEG